MTHESRPMATLQTQPLEPNFATCAMKSSLDWLALQGPSVQEGLLLGQSKAALGTMLADWRLWARKDQLPPKAAWRTWLMLGGRGAGKTRAGAEWIREQAVTGARLALIGQSLHDVREVMVSGVSGILNLSWQGARPSFEPSRRRIVFPSGAIAQIFSAEDPDSLRGPQFHAAWADEFCAWKAPEETLAMARLGLRLGSRPRLCVTTTPRPIRALKILMNEVGTVVTRAATKDNQANLSPDFVAELEERYGGTRLAAQELSGQVIEAQEGALWSVEALNRLRAPQPACFETVVVAVDPPATSHGDACGIVVVGRWGEAAFVLADESVRGVSPLGWARRVGEAASRFKADLVVAECNQGGEMVQSVLALSGLSLPVKLKRATVSKQRRAEPVALLYEQGRVRHCGQFLQLEEEMLAFGAAGHGSPDRVDALVWAISEVMLQAVPAGPGLRIL